MKYAQANKRLGAYREKIAAIRARMRDIQAKAEAEPVQDYNFATPAGRTRLSDLFGDRRDLFVIHNMGASCPYCTMWADGFNGVCHHLADRAAFVVSSPDPPAAQKKFAKSRGWRFPMVSHRGTSFAQDMGYRSESGGYLPGISVFQKKGGRILRVSDTGFSPGDDFCAVWHIFDLLREGADDWSPKFKYR